MSRPTSELSARQIMRKHVMDRRHQRAAHERKQAKEFVAAETKAERDSLVQRFGIERTENRDYANWLCEVACAVVLYFKGRQPNPVKIPDSKKYLVPNPENITEIVDILIHGLTETYNHDDDIDNDYERATRLGLLPKSRDAARHFTGLLGQKSPEQQALPLSAEPSKAETPAAAAPTEPPKQDSTGGFTIGDVVRRVGGLILFRIVSFPDHQHCLCLWDDNGKDEEIVLPISSLQLFTQ
jgi:hypothetical protein